MSTYCFLGVPGSSAQYVLERKVNTVRLAFWCGHILNAIKCANNKYITVNRSTVPVFFRDFWPESVCTDSSRVLAVLVLVYIWLRNGNEVFTNYSSKLFWIAQKIFMSIIYGHYLVYEQMYHAAVIYCSVDVNDNFSPRSVRLVSTKSIIAGRTIGRSGRLLLND